MIPYMLMIVVIVMMPLFQGKSEQVDYTTKKVFSKSMLPVVISFIILLFFSTFRGEINQDYNQYLYNLHLYGNANISLENIIQARQEPLFVLFMAIVGKLPLPYSDLLFLFATSFITISLFYKRFLKDSPIVWISVTCFVLFGGYMVSYNLIRQMIAVAICFYASDLLHQKEYLKYILIVIIAATIHISALFSLILLPLSFRKIHKSTDVIWVMVGGCILYVITPVIIQIVQKIIYSNYTDMSYQMMMPISFNKILLIVIILAFCFLIGFRQRDSKHEFLYNACLICVLLLIMSLRIKNVERIAIYFYPYICIAFPDAICSMKNSKDRQLIKFGFAFMAIIYMFITMYGSDMDPYVFYNYR